MFDKRRIESFIAWRNRECTDNHAQSLVGEDIILPPRNGFCVFR